MVHEVQKYTENLGYHFSVNFGQVLGLGVVGVAGRITISFP